MGGLGLPLFIIHSFKSVMSSYVVDLVHLKFTIAFILLHCDIPLLATKNIFMCWILAKNTD